MNKLGNKSKKMMKGVSVEMGLVVGLSLARGRIDFSIISGFRTAKEQNGKFLEGHSKLDGYNKISYHQSGEAIDIIPYPFDGNWNNTQPFIEVHKELSHCAKHLGFIPRDIIKWDVGHFALIGNLL